MFVEVMTNKTYNRQKRREERSFKDLFLDAQPVSFEDPVRGMYRKEAEPVLDRGSKHTREYHI